MYILPNMMMRNFIGQVPNRNTLFRGPGGIKDKPTANAMGLAYFLM